MHHNKIANYAYLAFAIMSFFLGIFFFIADPELLKPSGGGIGLILVFAVFIVMIFTPIFGSYASLIVYGVIGIVLMLIFIKKNRSLKNGI